MPAYPPARYGSVHAGGIEPARAEAIAQALMAAENPIAFDGLSRPQAAGGRRAGPAGAELRHPRRGIQFDRPQYPAGPRPASPAPIRCPCSRQADLGLLLDSDVPFVPQYARRAERDQMDPDRHRSAEGRIFRCGDFRPTCGFRAIAPSCCSRCSMRSKRAPTTPIAAVSPNASRAGAARARRSAKRRAAASANKGVPGALNPAFVFATLSGKTVAGRRRPQRSRSATDRSCRSTSRAQSRKSYVGLAGGGLGSRGGMALGLKLAQPDRRIVQVIGDGGFHFSSPDSVYAVAQQYQIPILTVVLDNGGWQAVKSAVQRVYPKGIAAETDQFQSRLTSGRQGERRDFSGGREGVRRLWRTRHRAGRTFRRDRALCGADYFAGQGLLHVQVTACE